MKPRLVLNLLGGLGNQLFQYACGWALAQEHGRALVLDAGSFDQYKLRPFLLDRLKITARRATGPELDAWGLQAGRFARIRRRLFGTAIAAVHEPAYTWGPLALPASGDVWLNGYWQSERYFAAHKAELKAQFAVKAAPNGVNARFLRAIRGAGPKAAALHVRRGDYVSSGFAARTHGSLGLGYYAAAVARLRAQVKGAKLFVFSDDPAWARANLPFAAQAVLVDANGPAAPEQDLRLMAACRHVVLANSTFSWWGAWLGERPGSRVLAPQQWFKTKKLDPRDLLPQRWQRVGNEGDR
jgi:hypothetical protein